MVLSSPIIYPVSLVPERYFALYFLNPIASIMCVFRKIILSIDYPKVFMMGVSFILPFMTLLIGWWVFNKLETNFADEL